MLYFLKRNCCYISENDPPPSPQQQQQQQKNLLFWEKTFQARKNKKNYLEKLSYVSRNGILKPKIKTFLIFWEIELFSFGRWNFKLQA